MAICQSSFSESQVRAYWASGAEKTVDQCNIIANFNVVHHHAVLKHYVWTDFDVAPNDRISNLTREVLELYTRVDVAGADDLFRKLLKFCRIKLVFHQNFGRVLSQVVANRSDFQTHYFLVCVHVPGNIVNPTEKLAGADLRQIAVGLAFRQNVHLAPNEILSHDSLLSVHDLLQTQGAFRLVHQARRVFYSLKFI